MLFTPKPFLFSKPFMWFTPDSGGGSGGGDGGDTGDDKGTGGGSGDDKEKSEKKFSQKDLDALVGEARKSGRETAVKKLLEELGVEDAEKLKTALAEAKKLKEAQMSEADKQKAALDAAEKAAADAKAEKETAIAQANERLMKAAVIAEASKADHKINPAAIADVWAFVDRAKLKVTETGDIEGAADAVKAVIKDRPYLQNGKAAAGTPLREGKKPLAGAGNADDRKRTVTKL